MEIEENIKNMKEVCMVLLYFIEATDDSNFEFKELIKLLEEQKIKENKDKTCLLFQLISKIADNHHRESDFYTKLEQIFQYLINEKPSPISNFIPKYDKFNILILFNQ